MIKLKAVTRAFSLGVTAACLLFGSSLVAEAALIDHGTYTSDTASGLDWLDLTATQGQSYNQVLAGSYVSSGWAYATLAQVSTLFDNAGGVQPYNFSGVNGLALFQGAATSLLRADLGDTSPFSLPGAAGMVSDVQFGEQLKAYYLDYPPTTNYLLAPFGSQDPSATDRTVGSFLIRVSAVRPVPEPLTLSLFGAGLAGVAAMRRRSRKS